VIGYGPPEELIRNPQSYTGQFLKRKLNGGDGPKFKGKSEIRRNPRSEF